MTEENGEQIHDAELTPHGYEECADLRVKFQHHDNVRRTHTWSDLV